ncbi:hypothetical protein LCGC14_3130530 [marine sediment metagenome]|uniref:Uncharacterized protein n=1 Tax=marine sediment metagenome TaxID=412755 RepID=A0A0F8VZW1_9ZZZZ
MTTDPVWAGIYRLMCRAELDSLTEDPESLLREAGKVMNIAVELIEMVQSWRGMKIQLEEEESGLAVVVVEHSGNRLSSPREVKMIFRLGNLSSAMLAVWEVMES